MKNCIILLCLLKFSFLFSQEDNFKLNIDFNVGHVSYQYQIHEMYSYNYYTSRGYNLMAHLGLHIPVYKPENWSFGFNPKIGAGELTQYTERFRVFDGNEYVYVDSLYLDSYSFDGSISAFARCNLEDYTRFDAHISAFVGYRYLRSKDTYSTPIIGFEIGQNWWSFEVYTHLISMHYYRLLSDGSTNKFKSFHESGIALNLYLGKRNSY